MEFIISKQNIPDCKSEMEAHPWFNMWKTRKPPYKDLVKGDILYFFDTEKEQLIWKTKITKLIRKSYSDKEDLFEKYSFHMKQQYYESRSKKGYILDYSIEVLQKINVPKPANHKLDRLGWEKLDNKKFLQWFSTFPNEEDTTIDENINSDEKSLLCQLQSFNDIMQEVSPERIKTLISTSIRKDTKIIKALKEVAGFKCQFPDCGAQIKKERKRRFLY